MMGDRDNILSPDEFQKQLNDIVEEIDNLSDPQEPNMEPQVASGSKPLPIIHTPSGIGKPNSPMDTDPHLEMDLGEEGMVPNDTPTIAHTMQTQATASQQALLTCPIEGQPAAQTDLAYNDFAHSEQTKAHSGMDPNSQGMIPINTRHALKCPEHGFKLPGHGSSWNGHRSIRRIYCKGHGSTNSIRSSGIRRSRSLVEFT